MNQLNREQAIAFAESGAWEHLSLVTRAAFQLEQDLLCMPFAKFHEAVEFALGRPVWTHEFALNRAGLIAELNGKTPAPSMGDIIAMLPSDKVFLLVSREEGK